jgi:hypothetical protein
LKRTGDLVDYMEEWGKREKYPTVSGLGQGHGDGLRLRREETRYEAGCEQVGYTEREGY